MLTLYRAALILGISAGLTAGLAPNAAADWHFHCFESGACIYVLTSTGTRPVVGPEQGEWVPGGQVPDPCRYRQVSPQPPPESAAWGGHDPAHGRLWQAYCPTAISLGNAGGYIYLDGSDPYYVPDGQTPDEAAPPDPYTLVQQARGRVNPPDPTLRLGPDPTAIAVKIPVWLWTEPTPPIVQTAAAGPLTATVTATLTSTSWDMGEPIDPADPHRTAAPVICAGPGTPFTAGADPSRPPCGYTYIWRSLPHRTDGTGTWTVTATATWTITFAVTGGTGGAITGSQTVTTETSTPVEVREWRPVLIGDSS